MFWNGVLKTIHFPLSKYLFQERLKYELLFLMKQSKTSILNIKKLNFGSTP
jgi:hypothetical protein